MSVPTLDQFTSSLLMHLELAFDSMVDLATGQPLYDVPTRKHDERRQAYLRDARDHYFSCNIATCTRCDVAESLIQGAWA